MRTRGWNRLTLPALLALFVAVGCDQQPVEPQSEQAAAAPALDWMNNPDNGNIKVYRIAEDFAVCWSDSESGLRACHATVPLGGGTEPDCGLQQVEAPLSYQDVGYMNFDDLFANEFKAHEGGDVWITIRDTNTAGDCFENALVAEGWGHIMYNDNDYFGAQEGDPSANAWSFKGQGQLTAVGGETVAYNGVAKYVCGPNQGCIVNEVVNVR